MLIQTTSASNKVLHGKTPLRASYHGLNGNNIICEGHFKEKLRFFCEHRATPLPIPFERQF